MSDDLDLMARAAEEIRSLRRANEILGAKVEVMELFSCVLRTRPHCPEQGYTEDLAWLLEKRIGELRAVKARVPPAHND